MARPRVGRFVSATARDAYAAAYESVRSLWPLPAHSLDVPTSFGTTRVTRSGTGAGTPLVLFHGLNGAGPSWHAAVRELADAREVFAVDILGTAGRSVQTRAFEADADVGRWFDEVLAGSGLGRVHLLGESNGAWVASVVAMHTRSTPTSLTLIEPNGFIARPRLRTLLRFAALSARPTESGLRRLSDWLTPGVSPTPEEQELARAAMGFRPGLGWARLLTDDELGRIGSPTLAIFGAESVLSRPAEAAARLRETVSDIDIVLVPNGGHAVHGQFPGRVRPAVLDFLAAHDPADSRL
ncbi:alpha/beta fold hydrolase [Agromyces sp. G08B096]|uniref:Alpha/beta fold hydrolase n=1 Tax=Agromyces sp. G08B096 TaxID=3156399 RepID=A0AAU7W742_9MICO